IAVGVDLTVLPFDVELAASTGQPDVGLSNGENTLAEHDCLIGHSDNPSVFRMCVFRTCTAAYESWGRRPPEPTGDPDRSQMRLRQQRKHVCGAPGLRQP